ncbi:hypothetical protein JOF35_006036 [Streptomyces demainii]|uniref:Transposase n=1 Tax=Streptomyces demainii TaxID=588122 RepID=A0ABT9KZ17_9ACTN|nr:hypothetical protein [Streptomyces demainii]
MRDRLGEHEGSQRGDLTGPNPVDRGKKGSKIHLITERAGLPISIGISGANLYDSQALEPLVRGIPPIRSRRGPRRRRPASSTATKVTTRPPAPMATAARHPTPPRPQRHRVLQAAGTPPLDDRTHDVLARRMPTTPPSLRTESRPLPGIHQHRLHPHLLPQTHQMRWLLTVARVGHGVQEKGRRAAASVRGAEEGAWTRYSSATGMEDDAATGTVLFGSHESRQPHEHRRRACTASRPQDVT